MAVKPRIKASFGISAFKKLSPTRATLSPQTSILNVLIPFEDALQLSVSIQQCVLQLNRYDRSTKAGKRTCLNVAIHLDQDVISVHEGNL